MAVYLINSYDITNPEVFIQYGPKVLPIILKHGGRVLASDVSGVAIEGKAKRMNAIIQFPSEEAVQNCYSDPDYQPVKQIRINSTTNISIVMVHGA
jgi:uncharacterized protein (DUF1330 family)